MEFSEVIKQRYSCKKYSGKQISKNQLDAILEAGRLAPTAKNLQEHHIYVVQSEEKLKLLDEYTPCRYGAPTVLVVTFDTSNVYTYPEGTRQSGVEDATIVATHLMLAATNVGVDSCWLNCVKIESLREALHLADNEEILMLLDLGYASDETQPLPNHFSRKPLTETVSYL